MEYESSSITSWTPVPFTFQTTNQFSSPLATASQSVPILPYSIVNYRMALPKGLAAELQVERSYFPGEESFKLLVQANFPPKDEDFLYSSQGAVAAVSLVLCDSTIMWYWSVYNNGSDADNICILTWLLYFKILILSYDKSFILSTDATIKLRPDLCATSTLALYPTGVTYQQQTTSCSYAFPTLFTIDSSNQLGNSKHIFCFQGVN